jgi:hypothetical protein
VEVLCHGGDLDVGQARVRLADRKQVGIVGLGRADGERVVREHATSLAVAPLDADHHAVEGGQRLFQLQPAEPAPAGLVDGSRILDHQALVAALARVVELRLHLLGAARRGQVRQQDPLRGDPGQVQRIQGGPSLPQRGLQQVLPVQVQ